jgi:lysozyme
MSDLVLDISNNQGAINVAPAVAWGVKALIAKATEGTTFTDGFFGANREQARRLNIPFGAYHFFRPGQSAVDQADHFCTVVQSLGTSDLRPVLDYETGGPQTAAQKLLDIRLFSQQVHARLKVYPIFYSYSAFLPQLAMSKTVCDGLWLANYGPDDGTEHPFPVPAPWKKVALHQFTSKGKIPGYSSDVDLSYGNLKALYAHPWKMRLKLV